MMKRLIYLCFVLGAFLTLASCDLESSDNGKLDGYWHLEQIDTIATGGVNDLSSQKLFWAVQAKLLLLTDQNYVHTRLIMRFNHTGERLILSEPYIEDREKGDQLQTEPSLLTPYGINALTEDFKVEKLSSSDMILSNEKYRLRLKKF